jgi:hypothetical protein
MGWLIRLRVRRENRRAIKRIRQRIAEDKAMNWHISFLQERLDAANMIVAQQNRALGQACAALIQAKAALEWYSAQKFEHDGVAVGDCIDDAIHELTH